MSDKKIKYDYNRLRRDIQDEYLAAMVVGFGENTPDLMDIQMASNDELAAVAQQYGYDLSEYVITEEIDPEIVKAAAKYGFR